MYRRGNPPTAGANPQPGAVGAGRARLLGAGRDATSLPAARSENIYLSPEHELLKEQIARFVAREVEPFALAWEEGGMTPREVLRKMGDAGLLGLMYASEYGGAEAEGELNGSEYGMKWNKYGEGDAGKTRLRIQVEGLKQD